MQPPSIFRARRTDIVVEQIADEFLVYDRRADTAHCLGDVAALVWRTCDGGATFGEIAEQIVAADLARSGDDAIELAETAVSELAEKGLLESSSAAAGGLSRRHALRRIAGVGAAAVAGPLVVSAAVPSAAAAASVACVATGGTCTVTSVCCTINYICGTGRGQAQECCGPSGAACSDSADCCAGLTCDPQSGNTCA